jgi:glycerate 2-kinase
MADTSNHIIRNFEALATTPARTALLSIAEAGLQAIRTPEVVRHAVSCVGNTLTVSGVAYDLGEYKHVYILGVGKCAYDAAVELEALLGDRISDGLIIDVHTGEGLTRIRARTGTHPYPSAENIAYTKELLDLAATAGAHDLVLVIISGGGSALLCQPVTHSSVEEANVVKHLFKGGATIEELNTVRKHLSKARGGGIAAAAHNATVVSLLFSDVPGNDLHTIASGPTILDVSTLADAATVLEKYHADRSGFSSKHLIETPKDAGLFLHVRNELVLTNETALVAMEARAKDLGYHVFIRDTELVGEARAAGKMIEEELRASAARTVLLYGGETTVTIHGPGKGGRNEELALGALADVADDELILSFASDGRDNTDFAGGIADVETKALANAQHLNAEDYLYTNDSFSFFHTLQQGVVTGYTGANVADLVIALKH